MRIGSQEPANTLGTASAPIVRSPAQLSHVSRGPRSVTGRLPGCWFRLWVHVNKASCLITSCQEVGSRGREKDCLLLSYFQLFYDSLGGKSPPWERATKVRKQSRVPRWSFHRALQACMCCKSGRNNCWYDGWKSPGTESSSETEQQQQNTIRMKLTAEKYKILPRG